MTDDSYRDDTIGYSIGNIFHPRANFLYMHWKIDQWNSIEPENLMNQFKSFPKSTPNPFLKFSDAS